MTRGAPFKRKRGLQGRRKLKGRQIDERGVECDDVLQLCSKAPKLMTNWASPGSDLLDTPLIGKTFAFG